MPTASFGLSVSQHGELPLGTKARITEGLAKEVLATADVLEGDASLVPSCSANTIKCTVEGQRPPPFTTRPGETYCSIQEVRVSGQLRLKLFLAAFVSSASGDPCLSLLPLSSPSQS